ncbi:hypothetical protein Holit_01212 [Hollandina sp. SP2]
MIFSFNVDKSISTLLASVKQTITKRGGSFSGNEQNGTFSIKGVVGEYSINGQTVKITITDKPLIVSDNFIQKEIKKYFNA